MSIIQDALKKAEKRVSNVRVQASVPSSAGSARYIFGIAALLAAILLGLVLTVRLFGGKVIGSGRDLVIEGASHQEVTYKPMTAEGGSVQGSPVSTKMQGVPELVLNGIMYLEAGPRAIINDTMVEEGDEVSGAKVVRINRRNVVLAFNNTEINIDLK